VNGLNGTVKKLTGAVAPALNGVGSIVKNGVSSLGKLGGSSSGSRGGGSGDAQSQKQQQLNTLNLLDYLLGK
jgi:hypothetical protein